ncbi:hypothetical protein [Amycolatopsis samaneae]|uniref:Excreted virulence factor EspC, type VII ESX diderm n=1 Tax=Amycolatopsis samaneae TaxID=664691 RepID=A0ABW5GES7_9PSEU
MAGVKIDEVVVAEYARKVDGAAGRLDSAVGEFGTDAVAPEAFGGLGAQLGVGESYGRAIEALRQQLVAGAAALHSAAEALHRVTSRHADRDAESAELIKRAGEL